MTPILLTPPQALTTDIVGALARSCYEDSAAAGRWNPLERAADTAREALRADLVGAAVGGALGALCHPERPLAYVTAAAEPDGYLIRIAETAIRALDLLGRVMDRSDLHGTSALIRLKHNCDSMYLAKWHHLVWHQINRMAHNEADYGMMFIRHKARVGRLYEIVMLCHDEATALGGDLGTLIDIKRTHDRLLTAAP